jgi:sulfur carrier protein
MFKTRHPLSDTQPNRRRSAPAPAARTRAPRRSGRLLGLIRTLSNHGKALLATVREPPPPDQLLCIRQDFGTCDPGAIIARIERGLRIAAALEYRIVNCAAYFGGPRTPQPASTPAATAASQALARHEPPGLAKQTLPSVTRPREEPSVPLNHLLDSFTNHVNDQPIGIVLTKICQDLGINYRHRLWWELLDAIDQHGGKYARFERAASNRKPVFDLFPADASLPLPAPSAWQSPSAAFTEPADAAHTFDRRFDDQNAFQGTPLPALEPSNTLTGRPPFLAALPCRAHIPFMQTVITVTLNGEPRSLDGPVSVSGLLESIGFEGRKVAVERNEAIVPRSRYAETWLATGDSLEIVHFIGGG